MIETPWYTTPTQIGGLEYPSLCAASAALQLLMSVESIIELIDVVADHVSSSSRTPSPSAPFSALHDIFAYMKAQTSKPPPHDMIRRLSRSLKIDPDADAMGTCSPLVYLSRILMELDRLFTDDNDVKRIILTHVRDQNGTVTKLFGFMEQAYFFPRCQLPKGRAGSVERSQQFSVIYKIDLESKPKQAQPVTTRRHTPLVKRAFA